MPRAGAYSLLLILPHTYYYSFCGPHILIQGGISMLKNSGKVVFVWALCGLALLALVLPVLAQNRVFLSTSLEFSEATYLIQFTASTGGAVDKLRLTFPAGMLDDQVSLRSLLVGDKPGRAPILTNIDPADPDTLIIDLPKTVSIKTGSQIQMEILGLKNPAAGDHQIEIALLGKDGAVLETISPLALSISSPGVADITADNGIDFGINKAKAPKGDITAVNPGAGLSGGGASGDVTLSVDTSQIQSRVTNTCPTGQAIRVIDQTGNVTCEAVGGTAGGTVTSVGTGVGLTGGPITTTGTISVADGAITAAKLGANSVDSSKIVDGSIGSVDVNTTQIQSRVTGTCTAGNAIRVVAADGSVTCESVGGGGAGGWTDDGTVVRLTTSTDNVGIGTSTPTRAKLETQGAVGNTVALFGGEGTGVSLVRDYPFIGFNSYFNSGWKAISSGFGGHLGVEQSDGAMTFYVNGSAAANVGVSPSEAMRITQSGNVGIGMTTPHGRLEVAGNGASVVIGDPGCGAGSTTAAIGFLTNAGLNCGNNFNFGANTTNKETVINRPTGGQISFREGNGTDQMRITTGGNVGIGTTSLFTGSRLRVEAPGFDAGISAESDSGTGVFGFSPDGRGVRGSSDIGPGVFGDSGSGIGVLAFTTSGDLFVGDRGSIAFRVTNGGDVQADGTFTSPAADFAELLEVDDSGGDAEHSQPGDVLVINPETGKLRRSSGAYSTEIAGVYSAKPGFLGGRSIEDESTAQTVPVALIGIVPTKASAENGAIRPGDLLTSSNTPGHAMKCTEKLQCFGATIGKALEPLDSGTGLIKVLVTLR
ncbi:MAG TPA: hypothetical protein VGL11_07900 [Candidatus Binatia bacterium]